MRGFTIIAVSALLASGLALAACGGDDDSEKLESADFAEADLASLVRSGDEPLPDMKPVQDPSGADLLEQQDGNEDLIAGLEDVGFVADYGTTFEAAGRASPILSVETLAVLFEDADAASEGLAFLEGENMDRLQRGEAFPDPELGAEAWGQQGQLDDFDTTVIATRIGDVVQVSTVAADEQSVAGASAGGLADELAEQAIDTAD